MRVAIIGAGMAGLACAESLVSAGLQVELFDKGRGVGGRMSCRRATTPQGPISFDHGAQYMTARDEGFRAQIAAWDAAGLVARWPAAGEEAWVGAPAMNAPLKAMSEPLQVRWATRVEELRRERDGWRLRGEHLDEVGFDAVLTALPAEQTGPLLGGLVEAIASVALSTRSDPCWTVMAAFADRLAFEPDVLKTAGAISWVARNSAKPGRSGPEAWVVQASPAWSRDHLEQEAGQVAENLLCLFFKTINLPATSPIVLASHRWRFARSASAHHQGLWDPDLRLGACGDWLLGPRIENAWLSGRKLAALVAQQA